MKILVIRLSSIGDVLLTTPVVRCLHTQLQDIEVHYLTKKANIALLENNPYIDVLHEYTGTYAGLRQLRNEHFDLVIDLHKNHRSCQVCDELEVKYYTYSKENFHKFVYVLTGWNLMSGRHVVERYMAAVSPLGVKNDNGGLDCYLPDTAYEEAHLLQQHYLGNGPYCVVTCGAQHYTKQIPTDGISALCANMPVPVVLLGDKNDQHRLEREVVHLTPKDVNLCGQTSLVVSAALVCDAAVVIAADTGLMHIAAAFRRPTVVVWGATAPPLGFTPYRTTYVDCQVAGLRCHPCSRQGGKRCRRGHFACMRQQNWYEVASEARCLMERYSQQTIL